MSNFPNNLDPNRNLPSTYQEVLRHAGLIDDEIIPALEALKEAFNMIIGKPDPDDPDPSIKSGGDIYIDPDDKFAKVRGVTVSVDNHYTKPSDYDRDISFEVAAKDAVGLPVTDQDIEEGREFATVMTVNIHTTDGDVSGSYPAWQLAYDYDEDGYMRMYFRKEEENGEWGEWTPVFDLEVMLKKHPELIEKLSHRQVIESDVLPADQAVGDYWFWPIQKGVDPVGDGTGIRDLEDIQWPPDLPDGYMFKNLDDPHEEYHVPATDCRYYFEDLSDGNPLIPDYEVEHDELVDVYLPEDRKYRGYYSVDLDRPTQKWYYCNHDDQSKEEIERALWFFVIIAGLVTDPDGHSPGAKVDPKTASEIKIVEIGTGEVQETCTRQLKGWFMIDSDNPDNKAELVGDEYRRYGIQNEDGTSDSDVSDKNVEMSE